MIIAVPNTMRRQLLSRDYFFAHQDAGSLPTGGKVTCCFSVKAKRQIPRKETSILICQEK